ncbi:hypothetical protein AURDEDRAFT_143477 [Auricularia subglabra TFB-10046 SS5]|nr:hypothetical protein AURDEDRAFT_143477 [Auricularia subglabra TFB-10046 SS5]
MTEAEAATTSTPQAQEDPRAFLDTVTGENAFFKAVARARPVGVHKHVHMLSIRLRIQRDTGVMVPDADIWDKLHTLYDLAALEQYEGVSWPRTDVSPAPTPISHPTESDNLRTHGFFQNEFSMTDFGDIWPLCLARAPARSPSPGDGPPSPAETATSARGKAAKGKPSRARGGRPSGRGRGGRGRGRGAPTKGGGDSSSELTVDEDEKSDGEDPEESRAGSTVQSGTPMEEDGDSEQSEEQEEDDAPATRRARGSKKRPAKRAPGPTPAKKKRKSGTR